MMNARRFDESKEMELALRDYRNNRNVVTLEYIPSETLGKLFGAYTDGDIVYDAEIEDFLEQLVQLTDVAMETGEWSYEKLELQEFLEETVKEKEHLLPLVPEKDWEFLKKRNPAFYYRRVLKDEKEYFSYLRNLSDEYPDSLTGNQWRELCGFLKQVA